MPAVTRTRAHKPESPVGTWPTSRLLVVALEDLRGVLTEINPRFG